MQYKPSKWVSGYKHGPAASYTQITRMGLFLNVSTSKFEPLDSTWDNLHSGGMFISDDNKIYFRDETNKDIYINSNADNEITIAATSGVTISGGNLIIGTAGKGIDFSAQTSTTASGAAATAELLDHYEAGTWTAGYTAGSGTITINTSYDLMRYTRIGRLVHVQGNTVISSVSTPSGQLTLTGLPFTVNNSTDGESSGTSDVTISPYDIVASVNQITGNMVVNTTTVAIHEFTGTTHATMADHIKAGSQLVISGTYTV